MACTHTYVYVPHAQTLVDSRSSCANNTCEHDCCSSRSLDKTSARLRFDGASFSLHASLETDVPHPCTTTAPVPVHISCAHNTAVGAVARVRLCCCCGCTGEERGGTPEYSVAFWVRMLSEYYISLQHNVCNKYHTAAAVEQVGRTATVEREVSLGGLKFSRA